MENQRVCDGKCQNCNLIQQSYCSAVRIYALMEHEQNLLARVSKIEEALSALDNRLKGENLIIAQGGGGAVKVSENTSI